MTRRAGGTDVTLHAGETLAPAADAATPSEGGALIAGRYRVLELVGSGGMGTVYRVLDIELDEIVALKTLRREIVDAPGALERFRRELKLARRVTHRGVARAFDMGEHAGERFLTMEYVAGVSLARRIEDERCLDVAEAVRIGCAIAEALAAAHEAGVVHRDLKPDNVLLTEGGRVVLTDFGVARAIAGDDPRATSAGGIVGTPAYMAPEQVEGGTIDARTDLYALGAVLFEMLTGALPFEAATPLGMAAARLVRAPRDAGALKPELPRAVVAVVERCLGRAPADRFASAEELGRALAEVTAARMPAVDRAGGRTPVPPGPRPVPSPSVVLARDRRLAVMPLRSVGPTEHAWIAAGLGDDLSDALSMIRGLRVRMQTGAPEDGEDAAAYGRRHDVDVVVDGSVRTDGSHVRATLRLVSTVDGFQVWAHRAEGAVGELLAVSDHAAHAIAEALAGTELAAPTRAAPPPEAVELYLRARQATLRTFVENEELHLLERALVLAPDDPTILAAFAIAGSREVFRPDSDRAIVPRALAAAERARALAPHLPEPHLAVARVRLARGEVVDAVRSLLVGRSAGPSVAEIEQLLGRIVADTDELVAARGHLERALWIDPDAHFARVDLGRIELFLGRVAEAREHLATLKARSFAHFVVLAPRFALWTGEPVEIDTTLIENPSVRAFARMMLRAPAERRVAPEERAILDSVRAQLPAVSPLLCLLHQAEAETAGFLGDAERSIASVQGAVRAGLRDITWARRCPVLAVTRQDPRFEALEAEVEARARPVREAYRAGAAATDGV